MPEDLKVEDQQGEILVTIPGTAFSARYHKPDPYSEASDSHGRTDR
jgi:hypothetical protein